MTKEEQQPLVGDVCANCKYGRYILDPTEPGYWWCDNPWTDGRVDCDHTCPRWKPWRMKRGKRAESENHIRTLTAICYNTTIDGKHSKGEQS